MIDEAQVRSVALFYFFALQDERLAFHATVKTVGKLQKRLSKDGLPVKDLRSATVHITYNLWNKYKTSIRKAQSAVTHEGGWILPEQVDMGAWRQFRKDADEDEFLAVLWSRVLEFSDEEISMGLGISVGTARHRVGRGLRHLGSMASGQITK